MSWDNVETIQAVVKFILDYSAQIFLSGFEVNRRLRYWGNCSYGDTSSVKRSFDIGGGTNYVTAVTGLKFAGSSGVLKSGQITLIWSSNRIMTKRYLNGVLVDLTVKKKQNLKLEILNGTDS